MSEQDALLRLKNASKSPALWMRTERKASSMMISLRYLKQSSELLRWGPTSRLLVEVDSTGRKWIEEEEGEEKEEEEEEEEGLFKADAVNEEDPERDRATPT